MKKIFGVLLATAILISSLILPVYAETIEDKDDSRLDIGEILGYSYTVFFNDGESITKKEYFEDESIEYPALTPNREYDILWSLSKDEYIAPPKKMPKEDVTVYAYKTDLIGFENYPQVDFINNLIVHTSSDFALSGEKSLKYQNTHTSNSPEYSIMLGKVTFGTAYKISFKYYVNETLKTDYSITPITSTFDSVENYDEYSSSKFTLTPETETGSWLDGTIYFMVNESYDNLYLNITANEFNLGDSIYFDDLYIEEMITADFILPEGLKTTSTNGTFSNNTFTAYFNIGEKITAPEVVTADETPVVWVDEDGLTVTEFKENGIYRVKLDAKGDLNVDGAVTTLDLALMKLYLVELIDVTEINAKNGDINSDGNVDLIDMAYLKLYLANLIEIN